MNNIVAHPASRRPRQYDYSVVDQTASLGEEIRRQLAWIALGVRKMDQDADFASAARDVDEAVAWLMTISLEVDDLEHEYDRLERKTPTTDHVDAAAEE